MKKLRTTIVVRVNGEIFGIFTTFKAAFDSLKSKNFEIKSYKYELFKFSEVEKLVMYAVKKEKHYFTVKFEKLNVNSCLLALN